MIESPLNAGRLLDGEIRVSRPGLEKRVALIGAMPSRRHAPLDDPRWEVWSLNRILPIDRHGRLRSDRWFELHPWTAQDEHDIAWLHENPVPCYTLDTWPWVTNSVRFPLEQVQAAFPKRSYYTCTFAFQIALALLEGVQEIGLWGVDLPLGSPREQTVERACVEYWLGLAEGRGVTITLPEECTMLWRPYLYGYDYYDELENIRAELMTLTQQMDLITHLSQDELRALQRDARRLSLLDRYLTQTEREAMFDVIAARIEGRLSIPHEGNSPCP